MMEFLFDEVEDIVEKMLETRVFSFLLWSSLSLYTRARTHTHARTRTHTHRHTHSFLRMVKTREWCSIEDNVQKMIFTSKWELK